MHSNATRRYHRQFWEAAEAHYLRDDEVRRYRHRQMADFFCGVWAERAKPYSAELAACVQAFYPGEAAADRRVRPQPLVLRGASVWECGAEVNGRRCAEAAEHLLRGGLLLRAAEELACPEACCARILRREAAVLLGQLAAWIELHHTVVAAVAAADYSGHDSVWAVVGPAASLGVGSEEVRQRLEATRRRVADYHRWVRKDAHALGSASEVAVSLLRQPEASQARADMVGLRARGGLGGLAWFPERVLGGCARYFDAGLAALKGNHGAVTSVAFNPLGSRVAATYHSGALVVWAVEVCRCASVCVGWFCDSVMGGSARVLAVKAELC